jgi:hypothetical protein
MKKEIFSQKGVSLYYAVIITSLLLAIAFGLGTIFISQIRGLAEMGNSTVALFGADSGMETLLYYDGICQKLENCTSSSGFYELCHSQGLAAYEAGFIPTTTCIGLFDYSTSTDLVSGLRFEAGVTTTGGEATTTIFRSKGIYMKTQREIEAGRKW